MRSPTAAPAPAADPRLAEAAQALEAMLLRQIVKSSGAFDGGQSAGAGVREDLFVNTLADAVARSGGIGLAAELQRSLGGGAPEGAPVPGDPGPPRMAVRERTPPGLEPPVAGVVTSRFGTRTDPLTGARATHGGVDVGAPEGTPIRAPAAGVVRSAGPRGGYGNAVELDHGDGLVTLYGHASEVLVAPGDRVEAGQPLATVGSTGRSTGPHLHFEVRMAGRPVDPSRVLKLYAQRADEVPRSGP